MTYAMYVQADDSRKSASALGEAKAETELHSYFIQDGRIDLLNDAIGLLREAVGDTPTGSGERATCANNLGVALHDRFERTGAETDLDDAIR